MRDFARLAFFFANLRHFDVLGCETKKCFECKCKTFRLLIQARDLVESYVWEWARMSLYKSLNPCTWHQIGKSVSSQSTLSFTRSWEGKWVTGLHGLLTWFLWLPRMIASELILYYTPLFHQCFRLLTAEYYVVKEGKILSMPFSFSFLGEVKIHFCSETNQTAQPMKSE